jgi:hypothetical protein
MATIKAKVQDAASSAKAGIDKARATAGEKVCPPGARLSFCCTYYPLSLSSASIYLLAPCPVDVCADGEGNDHGPDEEA